MSRNQNILFGITITKLIKSRMSNAKEMKYVMVVGNCGTGKSFFINRHVTEVVEHSHGPVHVTKATKAYESKDDSTLFFMDTVGLDEDAIPFEAIKGKNVCFVGILSSLRADDEKERIIKKLGKDIQIVFYCTYNYQWPLPNDILSINDFTLDQLPKFHPVPLSPMVASSAAAGVRSHAPAKNTKNKNKEESKNKRLFNKDNKLDDVEIQLAGMYKDGLFPFCDQAPVDLKVLKTQADLQKYRARGESILTYVLHRLNLASNKIEMMMSNERLSNLVTKWNLDDHFSSLYAESDTPGKEKRGDYIEALFGFVFEHKKNMLVSLTKKIVDE